METLYRRTEIAELREVTQSDINVLTYQDRIPELLEGAENIPTMELLSF